MRTLTVEPARVCDAAAIGRLSRDEVERGLSWRWTASAVVRAMREPETEVVVARCAGDVVAGFGIMKLGRSHAHIALFAVSPDHRRRGVGRAIFEWLRPLAVNAGLLQIRLEVRVANLQAQRFYRNLGFEPGRIRPGYYSGIEGALEMALPLDRRQVRG